MATTIQVDPNGDVLLQFPPPAPKNHDDNDRERRERRAEDPCNTRDQERELPGCSAGTEAAEGTRSSVPAGLEGAPAGEGPINLLVSSAVLCLVSPVFSALFTGPMAEGVAFRAADSPRPFPLALPEDSGLAFTIIANVFHHRSVHIPEILTTSELLEIATLADKYDLTAALRPYATLWVQRAVTTEPFHPDYSDLLGRCRLLLFAYVLDLPSEFALLSWNILLTHRQLHKDEVEYGFELPLSREHELLRHDLHGASHSYPPHLPGNSSLNCRQPSSPAARLASVGTSKRPLWSPSVS